jgi:hypothetical protein
MNCFSCRKDLLPDQDQTYGLHSECYKKWFKLPAAYEFEDVVKKNLPSKGSDNESVIQTGTGSFFHGNYKKYAATLNGEHYILKVLEDRYPELPDVEFTCNVIAREVGLNTADFYLVSLYGQKAFVTKNFIRTTGGSVSLSHFHHHIKDSNDYTVEGIIKIIESTTKRYIDVEQFIFTCLYDTLVGNSDRHLRNLGFIVTAKGTILSPIYDNPSALGNEHGDLLKMQFSPKGAIPTLLTKEPTIKDYVQEFRRLGYLEVVLDFYKKVNIEKIVKIIEESFCTPLMKTALIRLVSKRYLEFKNEIDSE